MSIERKEVSVIKFSYRIVGNSRRRILIMKGFKEMNKNQLYNSTKQLIMLKLKTYSKSLQTMATSLATLICLVILSANASGQVNPKVKVRFANPVFSCVDSTYCLDVQMQTDSTNTKLFGFNVRFFYDDNVLEFDTLTSMVGGYSERSSSGTGIFTGGPTSGSALFGLGGAAEYANLIVELTNTALPVTISSDSTIWTTFFKACFKIDFMTDSTSFCPSIIWEQSPSGSGGILSGSDGIVITATQQGSPQNSRSTDETAVQYNWAFTPSATSPPYGAPTATDCIMATCWGSIGDYVWNDSNNANGIQDSGEPGIAGVIVQLRDAAGLTIAQDTTNASGNYSFDEMNPGTYCLYFDSTSFPQGTGSIPYRITLKGAGTNADLDNDVFGLQHASAGKTALFTVTTMQTRTDIDMGLVDPASLPVDILEYDVYALENREVHVDWTSINEVNCDYYEVQRTNNVTGVPESLGTRRGRGTFSGITDYKMIDFTPLVGRSWYRIIQYDFDGTQYNYEWKEIFIKEVVNSKFEVRVFPMPATSELNVVAQGVTNGLTFELYDYRGRLVKTSVEKGNGQIAIAMNVQDLAMGAYTLHIINSSEIVVKKVLLTK